MNIEHRCDIQNWHFTLDAVEDWICIMTLDSKIVRSNKAVEKLFNKPVLSVTGKTCCSLLHGSDTPINRCPLPKVLQTRKRESAEIKTADNRRMMVTIDPVFNKDGCIKGAVHIARDITKSGTDLLPICSVCKKIRDQNGAWNLLESYMGRFCNISFSHGICPECKETIYGHQSWYTNSNR